MAMELSALIARQVKPAHTLQQVSMAAELQANQAGAQHSTLQSISQLILPKSLSGQRATQLYLVEPDTLSGCQLEVLPRPTCLMEAMSLKCGPARPSFGIPHLQRGIPCASPRHDGLAVWREGSTAHSPCVAHKALR